MLRIFAHRPEDDVDAELRFHLDERIAELLAQGASSEIARATAAQEFGDVDAVRTRLHGIDRRIADHRRRAEWWERLAQDARIALRSFGRSPAFSAAVVLILALGIGLSAAVFTVADATLIRRLPVRDQNRIVVLWGEGRSRSDLPIVRSEAREFARRTHSLEQVALVSYYGAIDRPIRERENLSRLRQVLVSGDFFDVLGVHPTLGRALHADDDVAGAAHAIVLSYSAWQRRFGGSSVHGRQLSTYDDSTAFTIVGVMPQGFEYPSGTDYRAAGAATVAARNPLFNHLHLIGRLKSGATAANARDDLTSFLGRTDGPASEHAFHSVVHTLPQLVLGDTRPALLAFAAAAALLLLFTCTNVRNLLLVRGLAREREIGVRSALGGSRARIIAQLLVESSLLATMGGALGVALAAIAVRAFTALAPPGLPRLDEIRLNATALAGAVAITALATPLFALAPALAASRVDLHRALRADARQSARRGSRRMSELLAGGQVALAVVILSTAGLLTRTLVKLQGAELSFTPSHLLIGELSVAANSFDTEAKQVAMLDRLVPRLAGIPGVTSVSPMVAIPFSGSHGWDGTPSAEGQSATEIASNPMLNMDRVSPAYFTALGIPIVCGRGFADSDGENAPGVVVISQSTARHFWPNEIAVGKRMFFGSGDTVTVVGVVPDTRYRDLRDARPSIYFPLHQQTFFPVPMTLAIRTLGPPADMVPTIRRVLRESEPGVALASAAPFETFLRAPLAQPRLNAFLLAVFAGAAVTLAAIGLFSVVATMVRQRTVNSGSAWHSARTHET
ncbi:MAG: ABC transporter permease [Gemmatimonadales bacterium]